MLSITSLFLTAVSGVFVGACATLAVTGRARRVAQDHLLEMTRRRSRQPLPPVAPQPGRPDFPTLQMPARW